MPKARKHQVSLDATPYYHCVSRCVRRAFLCGSSRDGAYCFEHRRTWIEERILQLSTIFAIDVCAYAVMSNHYHVVLHINAAKAHNWSDLEVCERWHQLYKGSPLTQKYLKNKPLTEAEQLAVRGRINDWRHQLMDISWFMRNVNEPIARQANSEDNCTGRFWEGRFKSQALLDEKALAACLAYVDLNPIRADMAKTPETSDHTSVQRRIQSAKTHNAGDGQSAGASLYPFVGNPREPMPEGLPFQLNEYLELVDWTGRIIRDDKRGAIPASLPPILERLEIDAKQWLILTTKFESRFKRLVGCANQLKKAAVTLGYKRTPGLGICEAIFS